MRLWPTPQQRRHSLCCCCLHSIVLPRRYGIMLGCAIHTAWFQLLAGLVLQTSDPLAKQFRDSKLWSDSTYQTYQAAWVWWCVGHQLLLSGRYSCDCCSWHWLPVRLLGCMCSFNSLIILIGSCGIHLVAMIHCRSLVWLPIVCVGCRLSTRGQDTLDFIRHTTDGCLPLAGHRRVQLCTACSYITAHPHSNVQHVFSNTLSGPSPSHNNPALSPPALHAAT